MSRHRYQNHREKVLSRMKERRDAIIAAGGPALEELREKERERRAAYRAKHPDRIREQAREKGYRKTFKTLLCAAARARGRKRGMEATITPSDLDWPTHCPVLGIELDYPERGGDRKNRVVQGNWPSLDRWDSTKGYVPGNVFVISYRANTLKNSATYQEVLRIAEYLKAHPGALSNGSAQVTC